MRVSYRFTRAAQLASSDPFAGSALGTLANVRLSIWDDVVMLLLIELVEVVDVVETVEVVDVVDVVEDDDVVVVDA
jgi:hypothetical protein